MKVSVLLLVATAACSSKSPASTTPETQPGSAAPVVVADAATPARPTGPTTPTIERALSLREAADQLEKAEAQLQKGNKNLAEQLFSTAEILTGPEALAPIAPIYREGAPPRVTTPTIKVDTAAPPQPAVAGNSEAEDEADNVPPPPKKEIGTLTGTMAVGGKAGGAYGLITLEPTSGKWKPRTPKQVVIEQRGREFMPSLVAVSVGSTISFPNFDTVFHNVFSTSQLAAFDLGLYKAGEARQYTFNKEGFIRLGCNLHANMSAFIAVVSAPSYVVTDQDGNFAFKRLKPGKYTLKAWSTRSQTPITQEITIKAGANEVKVGVDANAPAGPQADKFGGKRG